MWRGRGEVEGDRQHPIVVQFLSASGAAGRAGVTRRFDNLFSLLLLCTIRKSMAEKTKKTFFKTHDSSTNDLGSFLGVKGKRNENNIVPTYRIETFPLHFKQVSRMVF